MKLEVYTKRETPAAFAASMSWVTAWTFVCSIAAGFRTQERTMAAVCTTASAPRMASRSFAGSSNEPRTGRIEPDWGGGRRFESR